MDVGSEGGESRGMEKGKCERGKEDGRGEVHQTQAEG